MTMSKQIGQYQIEAVSGSRTIAYKLHGTHGGVIRLVRNQVNPELLYAINKNGNAAYVNGSALFTDKDGDLKAVTISSRD